MKKIFILFVLPLSFVLITRFISVKTPSVASPIQSVDCLKPNEAPVAGKISCLVLEDVNAKYVKNIKPIFSNKCAMCHGSVKSVPLYSVIPPSSWLVQHDVKEAKEELDISADYPFLGKKSDYLESLEEIKEVIDEGEMPPSIYLVMHWQSFITKDEKQKIMGWVGESEKALREAGWRGEEE